MKTKDIIKHLAQNKQLTLAELERKLDISNGTIGKWDVRKPNTEPLEKVADYFNVSTDYLLGRDHPIEWGKDFETIELQELLRGNHSLAYNEGEVTEEDRKAIDNMITGYYWHKQQED